RQKAIVRAVRAFLQKDPPLRTDLRVDGMVISLLARSPNLSSVSCGFSCLPFFVDGAPMVEAVREKVQKYRGVVEALSLPLVVCVVPAFNTARELPELQRAVLGDERCRLMQEGGVLPWGEHNRDNNGLFAKYPALSAVTLVHLTGYRATHALIHNPS